ncbi:MAG: CvpA family protein [bacterium]
MFQGFNLVDGAAAVVVLVGILGGIRRGLSGELARFIAAAAALYVAWRFAQPMAAWVMDQHPMSYEKGYTVAFFAILLSAFAMTWLLRAVLRSIMLFAFKGNLERVGGALCGMARAAIVVVFLVLLVSLAPAGDLRARVVDESFIGPIICRHVRPMYDELRERTPELPLPGPGITNDEAITVTDEAMPEPASGDE